MEKIWEITYRNYQGDYFSEYYHYEINAKETFLQLYEENRHQQEFEGSFVGDWKFSYFDPNYNEYSTFISLKEMTMDEFFAD